MSEQDPPLSGQPTREDDDAAVQQVMPRWVPVLIGVVLVAMAIVAVYTGLKYRGNTLTAPAREAKKAPVVVPGSGSPGEPQPGASLMFPGGERGENVPAAGEPVTGNARAVVTGSTAGVDAVVRIWARRGMQLSIEPPDALVSVNNMPLGQASQFDTEDEIYDFAAAGSYTVRVSAPGYADRTFIVTASGDAKDEVALIKVKLVASR